MKAKRAVKRSPARADKPNGGTNPIGFGIASEGLGARLRVARERSGMGLRELARRVDVSPSLVSQIELGRAKPSVGTLYSIANELGLLLDELFRDADPKMPKGQPAGRASAGAASPKAGGPVQRRSRRKTLRLAGGVRWERLTAAPDNEVEFLYVVYDAGAASCEADSLVRHGGKEYAYMLSGRLGVKVGFEEFQLGPGDSISFDAQSPHRLWAIGREPAVAVWVVVNRHGDRRVRKQE